MKLRVSIDDDDNDDTRNLLRFSLEMSGAEVQTSSCAADAMRSLTEWHPDILLTDINMPGEDGYSVIRRVRADNKTADLPAIALTAMARPEDSETALSADFQIHLAKPEEIDELAEAIASLAKK